MSRHSKWSKIKHQKGVEDVKKAAVFTKYARVITVAAREGGDPGFNFKLRVAIDQARNVNMPKDNIERAIKKGTGELGGEVIESITYEGFGPGGVAIIVDALTDNRNRTSATMKHAFSSHGGNLAAMGAVAWMFNQKGIVRIERTEPLTEAEELALIDAGADDIRFEEGGTVIVTPPEILAKVREVAEKSGLTASYAGIEWTAKETVQGPDGETKEELDDLLNTLEDDEDVNAVYSNLV